MSGASMMAEPKTCQEHSGICAQIAETRHDIVDIKVAMIKMADRLDRPTWTVTTVIGLLTLAVGILGTLAFKQ